MADLGAHWRTEAERLERRSESRLPAHGPARIHWRVEGEGVRGNAVDLLGISSRGLSFRSYRSLALEQKILVQPDGQEFEAVVRHSAPDGREFIIGAAILSGERKVLELTAPTDSAADQVIADRKLDSSAREFRSVLKADLAATLEFVAVGDTQRLDGMASGLHKFQCCIHPWMRAAIRAE
jgi:hypothetical protein